MNLAKKFFLLSLLFANPTLQAQPLKTTPLLVTVGAYSQHFEPTAHPLIVTSDNGGAQWRYVAPPSAAVGYLDFATCNGTQCIAIGHDQFSEFPVLLTSSDPQHAWQSVTSIPGMPSKLTYSSLSGLSCDGSICNITGGYHHPFLLHSEDSGKTWTYNNVIADLPQTLSPATYGISCSGKNCAIVGDAETLYDSASYTHPSISVSHDSGRSWTYIKEIQNLPAVQHEYSQLKNVICNEKNCVAVGHSRNGDTYETKPLIVYSDNEGKTWNYTDKISGLPKMAREESWATTNNVACTDNFCIAGGQSHFELDDAFANKPLLLSSNDTGKTWNFTPVTVISKERDIGDVNTHSPHCRGSYCVMLGDYTIAPRKRSAFILASKDKGVSWTVTKTIPGAPNNLMENAMLVSLNCTDNHCVIAGEYAINTKEFMFFLLSDDHGMTWTFNQNVTSLPDDMFFTIKGISGSTGDDELLSSARRK